MPRMKSKTQKRFGMRPIASGDPSLLETQAGVAEDLQ